jgi:protein N-terminal glutamine amidohydrolase
MTRYAPFYCEENIWHLANDGIIQGVAFISNPRQQVACFAQGRSKTGEVMVWDYHVIGFAVESVTDALLVWDFDSTLTLPCPAVLYLQATFPALPAKFAHVVPWFRLCTAADFVANFASDRRHMRKPDGSWEKPPPPWPCIQAAGQPAHTLGEFVDVTKPANAPGIIVRAPTTDAVLTAMLALVAVA